MSDIDRFQTILTTGAISRAQGKGRARVATLPLVSAHRWGEGPGAPTISVPSWASVIV